MWLVILPLLAALVLAYTSQAAPTAVSTTGYGGTYEQEPRLQLEADVPVAAIGRARGFVVDGRVTDSDLVDAQFVLKHAPGAVESLHDVRSR